MSPSSLALSNLRAIVILIVLSFHSMLAYLVWVPIAAATDFISPPYAWRSFPIIDDHRFFGFVWSAPGRTST
jgi:glucan biosynthesis protein C